ncbi:response regulator [Oceanisphaera pacifica]|uniref:Response regulator n=1 Tax=Oceanisphaera pacifica TaxID=2818389 RepID=A0ABS3ND63_9GAMM|nr:response regulator [Oceanisphaera pacifica]MBO1518527.1 response regulator [Oceanisphaera pacifica]
MTLQILICDDSAFARKQVAGALPQHWEVQIQFACNGIEALEHLRNVGADLLFLDLNMPGLGGYEVLKAIQNEDLQTITVVISGDIQKRAQQQVTALGAIGFIKKPIAAAKLADLLNEYGLYQPNEATPLTDSDHDTNTAISLSEYLQEMANIAMGQASNLLAQLLGVFIHQPIPKVAWIERCDLHMAMSAIDSNTHYSIVGQGFVGAGVSGEALLLFSDSSSEEMAKLLNYDDTNSLAPEIEVLLDMANILFGAFIKGLGEQLDIKFGLSQPNILGQHKQIEELLIQHKQSAEQLLCIEIPYELEQQHISCHLLVLLTADSVTRLEQQLMYLTE